MIVATTNDPPGDRIVKRPGPVRGVTVRSRSVLAYGAAAVVEAV